jgi:hypothetical protein
MSCKCKHTKDFLQIEMEIIEEHIDRHKYFRSIINREYAIVDFINRYAWIMREVFCGFMCPQREECLEKEKFSSQLGDISDGEIREYIKTSYLDSDNDLIRVKLLIIKHDILVHKYLNKIDNYEDAVKDFLDKFGWIIFETYKKTKKKLEKE